MEIIREPLGLSSVDIREFAAAIINIVISFLGILAVVLFMYAGLKWMFSMGDDEKIASAKKAVIQTIIGLIIIFDKGLLVMQLYFVGGSFVNTITQKPPVVINTGG